MLSTFVILGVADSAVYAMWIANLTATVALAVITLRVSATTTKLNRSEDQRREDVNTIRGELHATAQKLIDERFQRITHSVNNHAQTLTSAMDKLALKAEQADRRIGEAEKDLLKTSSEMREKLHECAPTRDEHDELKNVVKEQAKALAEATRDRLTLTDLERVMNQVAQNMGRRAN
jgi:chromosome segregation ATPase